MKSRARGKRLSAEPVHLAYYSLPPGGTCKAKVVRVLQEDYIVEWADGATSGRRVPHDKVEPLEYEA